MPLQGNAIVAQSGGPTAVINNSVCGVVQTWLKEVDFGTVYAGISGVKGILAGDVIDLKAQDADSIAALRYTPGAGIFSCRYKVKEEDQDKLIKFFREHNIRYFFYNGGNDSMDTAHKTWEAAQAAGWEMRVIGIPKTIDNDLPYVDHSPGFGSAAKYIATTVRETGIDLESVSTKNKVTILEAMGRDAGWLTAAAALSRRWDNEAPHLIYLPEVPFIKERFLANVERVYQRLGYCYVVVSEGITNERGEYCFASGSLDAFGHQQLSGVGIALKDLVEREIGIHARCNTLGTAQRVAMHFASKTDADEAYLVGAEAVHYALADKSGVMVTLERESDEPYRCVCGEVELGLVANQEKKLPLEWINEAGNYVNEDFISYARPLIQGEVEIPMQGGLPDYGRIDFSKGRL
jgi:ATP-dependent phosphofructokinase / diphosphate-dependent phosphofructokinase